MRKSKIFGKIKFGGLFFLIIGLVACLSLGLSFGTLSQNNYAGIIFAQTTQENKDDGASLLKNQSKNFFNNSNDRVLSASSPKSTQNIYIDGINGDDGKDGSVGNPIKSASKALDLAGSNCVTLIVMGAIELSADYYSLNPVAPIYIQKDASYDGEIFNITTNEVIIDNIIIDNQDFSGFFTTSSFDVLDSLTITNSSFKNLNNGGIKVEFNLDFALNISSCDFIGVSRPKEDSSSNYGGALNIIASSSSYSRVTISNSKFEGCKAYKGGAICFSGNFSVNIDNTVFNSNYAVESVIYLNNNSNKLNLNNVTFSTNEVENNLISFGDLNNGEDINISGGSFADNKMTGETNSNNGLIKVNGNAENYAIIKATNGVSFTGNTCNYGAILQLNQTIKFEPSGVTFSNNTGNEVGSSGVGGGAIYVGQNAKLDLSDNNVTFGVNISTLDGVNSYGNAVYVASGGTLSLKNFDIDLTSVSISSSLFYASQNAKINVVGGTISNVSASSNKVIGTIFYVSGEMYVNGLTATNCQGYSGGVVYASKEGSVVLENINFNSNSATYGGAVSVGKVINLTDGINLGELGGAIFFKSGSLQNNTASKGGAVYVGENGSFESMCVVKSEIVNSGASLLKDDYVENNLQNDNTIEDVSSIVQIYDFGEIKGNTSTKAGGGIYVASGGLATINGYYSYDYSNKVETINDNFGAVVMDNVSNGLGGGIYIDCDGALVVNGGAIKDNKIGSSSISKQGSNIFCVGGAIRFNGGLLKVTTVDASVDGELIYATSVEDGKSRIYFEKTCFLNGTIKGVGDIEFGIEGCKFDAVKLDFDGESGKYNIFARFNKDDFNISQLNFESAQTKFNFCNFNNCSKGFTFADAVSTEISNCNFEANRGELVLSGSNITLKSNVFDDNHLLLSISGSYIYLYDNNINSGYTQYSPSPIIIKLNNCTSSVIEQCVFENIVNNYSETYDTCSLILIQESQVEFRDCQISNNTNFVNILNIKGSSNVTFKQTFNVQNNTLFGAGSGAVYVESGQVTVQRNTLLIIDNNTYTKDSKEVRSNLVLESDDVTSILQGDLNADSRVGITKNDGVCAIAGLENHTLSSDIMSSFYSDNDDYVLQLVFESNNQFIKLVKKADFTIVVNSLFVPFNALKTYSINAEDITIYYEKTLQINSDYIIKFFDKDDNEINAPSYKYVGNYEVFFRVYQLDNTEIYHGSTTINIFAKRLYIEQSPKVNKYGNAYRIFDGFVVDEDGSTVSGSWEMVAGSMVDNRVDVKFSPNNASYYDQNNIHSLVANVEIFEYYNRIFYYYGSFYATCYSENSNGVYKDETGITDLQTAINHLNNNGQIVFGSTYKINRKVEIICDKTITLSINYLFKSTSNDDEVLPMFDIQSGSLQMYSIDGNIIVDGNTTWSIDTSYYKTRRDPIFYVREGAKLTLGNNVVIKNFYFSNRTGSPTKYNGYYVGAVVNYGTTIFDNCEVSNNMLYITNVNIGGIIKNFGNMVIRQGKFYNNYMRSTGNSNNSNSYGGFLYSSGTLTISGGEIINNRAGYGSAICLGNLIDTGVDTTTSTISVLYLLGGDIVNNYAFQSNGGAINLNGSDTLIVIGNGKILNNINGAISSGSTVITKSDSRVVDSNYQLVSDVMLAQLDQQNQIIETKQETTNYSFIIWIILGSALVLSCIVTVILIRKNTIKNKKKKQLKY